MTHDELIATYKKTHPISERLHERAIKAFAGEGATSFVRALDPFRPYITHAQGSKKWDADGHEYIDYVMGHGALLLGHSHPSVVQAVQEQIVKGVHYGDNHQLEVEWAEIIKNILPSTERVEFFACGQEANLMAIRLSRIFTGRKKILRFIENFHGWADEVALPPDAPGIVSREVKTIPYDLEEVERELATDEYAILMTEGGGAHMSGQVPLDLKFVKQLPDLAHKHGTVWHMDEVVTGFRDAVGGFQALAGVTPDLTSLGKIVAGGLGAGALVGPADIMKPLGRSLPREQQVSHSGTWNANPLTAAAGIATLNFIKDGKPQAEGNRLASYLRQQGNQMFKDKGISGWLYGRSITHLYLGPIEFEPADEILPPTNDFNKIVGVDMTRLRLNLHLLSRGVATLLARMFILSTAHTEEDVDKTVSALAEFFDAMRAEGSLGNLEKLGN
ncbi:MAG: aminotransferase class III-fold pyridoxal phosphate-dependent enzyme [Deltaproteobacteria bacterium]|nr:aminotransferase class III-fold pyridoxal phosphate-dependent enzyme [Deltaproteobacteria bacterium]